MNIFFHKNQQNKATADLGVDGTTAAAAAAAAGAGVVAVAEPAAPAACPAIAAWKRPSGSCTRGQRKGSHDN